MIDRERGFTTHGPHRDDFTLLLGGHNARTAASRGETRTLILILKILEVQLLEAAREHPPLLLLDDVFSELDGARRQALTKFLQPYQTFITTTDADVVVQHFTEAAHIIPLEKGQQA
jgi:DNA replication and repair protein RecF